MISIADLFCGAGGTSTGAIEAVESLGKTARLTAVNHWDRAIDTHSANHPGARHFCASLDSLNPRELFGEGELDLLIASPECTHHSVARGGKPINDQSRSTAWCVVRWAEALRPRYILVENVPEFESWGAIGADNKPLQSKKGEIFFAWVNTLKAIGYKVDWRVLCAADYGDPTSRRRLFVQCVRGRSRITWPEPTHSHDGSAELFGTRKRWVPARKIIDWTIPGTLASTRPKPLAENTLKKMWAGFDKFGGKEFLIAMEHGGRVLDIESPLPTVTTAKGGAFAVAKPFILTLRGTSKSQVSSSVSSIESPIGAISTSGAHHAIVQPFLIHTTHGGDRAPISIDSPLPTVCGKGGDIAVCQPYFIEYYGNGSAESIDEPLNTVTTKERHALVTPVLNKNQKIDFLFRMLQPHELAAAQGFRKDYIFTGTKTEQVKQIGNAVPRNLARAIIAAMIGQDPSTPEAFA